jgi:hypothetical protein
VSIVDDARLQQLAARRPKDVFPILERAASLSPLVVVLTILPGIVSLESVVLGERDAQWRLKGLEVSTVSSLLDAVDPGASSTVSALRYQPPLGTWLAAASARWFPFGPASLQIFEYLSAACLVPACYLLMSRLAGRRIGFIAAALAAFHGTFVEQYRHAGPYALAVSAALMACWGFIGHVRQAGEIVSIDLLIGGLALGVCLLAGGPLALVVVFILLLVSLVRVAPYFEGRTNLAPRSRRLWSTWHTVRSLGVMVATAFAAGGWWELMMLYSYGRNFGTAWLFAPPDAPRRILETVAPLASTQFAQLILEQLATAGGALGGLTVLGLWIIGRRLLATPNGESRAPLRFLAVWIACSFGVFAAGLIDVGAPSLYSDMWRLFFAAACVCCSAVALDEVVRRRVSLLEFVCLTFATLASGYAFLRAESLMPSASLRAVFMALAAALLIGRVAQEFCRGSDIREWLLIAGLLGAFVLSDAWIGLSTLRTPDPDFRALTDFGRSLRPDKVDAEACLLISEGRPPARLEFILKSVWPKAQILAVRDWDEALKVAVGEGNTPKTAVVVDWTRGNSRPANPTGARWDAPPIGNPQFFQERPLRAYVLVWE